MPVPSHSIMFIDFNDLVRNTEGTLKEVFEFVGVDPARYKHTPLPPGAAESAVLLIFHQFGLYDDDVISHLYHYQVFPYHQPWMI